MQRRLQFDIAIAGGGYAGLALALSLARTPGTRLRIAVVDRNNNLQRAHDPRAVSISQSSKCLLDAIGAWHSLAADAQQVTRIAISDSPLEAGIRPILLSYRNIVGDDLPGAYIVPANRLVTALTNEVAMEHAITIIRDKAVEEVSLDDHSGQLLLSHGSPIEASLIIAADGTHSVVRDQAGIKTIQWNYSQTGIVTIVAHERPHDGLAIQHFLPAGPFAILPLKGHRSCITWSETTTEAKRIMALDDAEFHDELDQRFGGMLGWTKLDGTRASWPLTLHMARSYIGTRLALVGDAAHTVHPIAGQGLNLAFRDVAALTECIVDIVRLGFDPGHEEALRRYQHWRRFDNTIAAFTFDTLNRTFRPDIPILRAAREAALGLVDRMPSLKRLLISQAAGLTGQLPKLLQGKQI